MGNVRSGRQIDSALCKKGFRRTTIGKHIHYFFGEDSLIVTHMSHGAMSDTIAANLISKMARQLGLTKKQFLALIDCTLDKDGYREILSTDYTDLTD